jgi:hypothetical protein
MSALSFASYATLWPDVGFASQKPTSVLQASKMELLWCGPLDLARIEALIVSANNLSRSETLFDFCW